MKEEKFKFTLEIMERIEKEMGFKYVDRYKYDLNNIESEFHGYVSGNGINSDSDEWASIIIDEYYRVTFDSYTEQITTEELRDKYLPILLDIIKKPLYVKEDIKWKTITRNLL